MLGGVNAEYKQKIFGAQGSHGAHAKVDFVGSVEKVRDIEVNRIKAGHNAPLQLQQIRPAHHVERIFVPTLNVSRFHSRPKFEGGLVSQVTQRSFRPGYISRKNQDIEIAKLAPRNFTVQSLG